ncbi:MAG: acetamidase/formamidase family protein, partial [Atopobiaceae bacterium]|nr:acetamidase/formamidase family protein [Atopobiaceae bacterium]
MLKLTEWTHMFDKDNAPIARCESGDVVTFVTRDCFDGQVTVGGNVELTVNYDQCNPATGPLYVEGAEPGDALVVD